jgi:putative flavoprotein involved in K+ transport
MTANSQKNPTGIEELPQSTQNLIIGAGPAGLSLSNKLKKYGQEHVLVEKKCAAASWISMHEGLHLVSPWWTNVLDLAGLFSHWPFAVVNARRYANYLTAYRTRHKIQVHGSCSVHRIRQRTDKRYDVDTSKGQIVADKVICATGYFCSPRNPAPPYDDDGSIDVIHTGNYAGMSAFHEALGERQILIVGKRISAGQLMVELYEAGYSMSLACRGAVEFRRDGVLGWLKDTAYYFYEEMLLRRHPDFVAESFPPMDGGKTRTLIESGLVHVHPPVRRIHKRQVEFVDGSVLEAGLVINATGYRPALPELPTSVSFFSEDDAPTCSGWESTDSPGLYFLGLANRPNYGSRTLRGIRRDSRKLAKLLVKIKR